MLRQSHGPGQTYFSKRKTCAKNEQMSPGECHRGITLRAAPVTNHHG